MDWGLFIASLYRETCFTFSRSAGAGGQNVNKLSTKVRASVALSSLRGLSGEEFALIRERLAGRISGGDILSVTVQDTRSQAQNRDLALRRLEALVRGARRIHAKRRATHPTLSSCRVRLEGKKLHSRKKAARRKPGEAE